MEDKKVSVIIPAYGRLKELMTGRLELVRLQRYKDLEVIVIYGYGLTEDCP